jgi:uncharacterized membrane protein
MANDKFSIKEALKYGWDTFKANVPFFIGFMLVLALITVIPDYIADKVLEPKSAGLLGVKIVLRLIGLVLGMASTRISLDIHDSGQPDLSRIGTIIPQIPSYLVSKILYGLIVLVGLLLLVIPGLIAAYMFLYVGYLVIDRGMGPVAALGESRILTDGYKMDLFLFSLVVALVNILGVICLFVGLFVTIPTTLMASAYVYRKLNPAETVAETA